MITTEIEINADIHTEGHVPHEVLREIRHAAKAMIQAELAGRGFPARVEINTVSAKTTKQRG